MNTKLLAQLIREAVADMPPIGMCVTGCGAKSLPDYPACDFHAQEIHFTHRESSKVPCVCNKCAGITPPAPEPEPTKANRAPRKSRQKKGIT